MAKFLPTRVEILSTFKRELGRRPQEVLIAAAFLGNGECVDELISRTTGASTSDDTKFRIVTWADSGGTNPDAVRRLIHNGIQVRHRPEMHSKVYAFNPNGTAIVGSANFSDVAFGLGSGAKIPRLESGVHLRNNLSVVAWFEELWLNSSEITDTILARADAAWSAKKMVASEVQSTDIPDELSPPQRTSTILERASPEDRAFLEKRIRKHRKEDLFIAHTLRIADRCIQEISERLDEPKVLPALLRGLALQVSWAESINKPSEKIRERVQVLADYSHSVRAFAEETLRDHFALCERNLRPPSLGRFRGFQQRLDILDQRVAPEFARTISSIRAAATDKEACDIARSLARKGKIYKALPRYSEWLHLARPSCFFPINNENIDGARTISGAPLSISNRATYWLAFATFTRVMTDLGVSSSALDHLMWEPRAANILAGALQDAKNPSP